MEHSIMNSTNELTIDSQMDLIPTLEEVILDVRQECGLFNPASPETLRHSGGFEDQIAVSGIEPASKSACVQRVKRVLKKLDSIASAILKILLPKNILTTTAPDRQTYY